MQNWLRSASVLAAGFGGVLLLTLGFAAFIVPSAAGSAQATDAPSGVPGGPPSAGGGPITTVGGTLAVTGDREGSFVLDRESTQQGAYSLIGGQGRIYFGGEPLAIERISYDGLEFYVDEGECTLEPGERDDPTGVAGAGIRCEDIADIRDGGTISLEGTVGISADLFGLRGDLPHTGGTIQLGDDELTIPFAVLFTGASSFAPPGGVLVNDDGTVFVHIDYDFQTHALSPVAVEISGEVSDIPAGACTMTVEVIGVLNPRTDTAELTLECPSVQLVSGETVGIGGTVVVDLIASD